MERLTKKIDSCTVFPEELVGVTLVPDNPIMCKMLLRLAAYEDTGLEPEICAEYKKFEDEIVASGKTFNHLIELLRAEKEGRLVVLPVRPVLTQSNGEINIFYTTLDDQVLFEQADIGKTVFLTREEAEKALENMNGRVEK